MNDNYWVPLNDSMLLSFVAIDEVTESTLLFIQIDDAVYHIDR